MQKVIIVLCFFSIIFVQEVFAFPFETKVSEIYEKINPAIVNIDVDCEDGVSTGAGCVINPNGTILTGSHVIEGAKSIEVTVSSGQVYPAKIISVEDKKNDLVLIKIDAKELLPTIKIGDSSKVKTGESILAIGNPFGFSGTLTGGIISRIDYTNNKIQTDAAINPGSSGGPIVNLKGEVIGISQAIYNPDNNKSNIGIGFAIPINEAKGLIKDYSAITSK